MLGLRTVNYERKSYGGTFQWPSLGGTAIAPDWDGGMMVCGGGLHFLPWGEGESRLLDWSYNTIWQVVDDHDALDTVLFDKRAKAQKLTVVFEGDRKGATDYILTHGGRGRAIVGATVIVGNYSKVIAGDHSKAIAGIKGKAIVGNDGISIVGDWGKAEAGNYSKAIAGDYGRAIAGDYGKAETGDYGKAETGNYGMSIAGDFGLSITGTYGKAKAGIGSTLTIIFHLDNKRWRTRVAYVGEDGILPNIFYKLDDNGKFVLSDT